MTELTILKNLLKEEQAKVKKLEEQLVAVKALSNKLHYVLWDDTSLEKDSNLHD